MPVELDYFIIIYLYLYVCTFADMVKTVIIILISDIKVCLYCTYNDTKL